MIRFDCLSCGKKLTVPDDRAGKLGKCPGCKETFRIPGGDAEDEIPEELETVSEAPARSDPPPQMRSDDGLRPADVIDSDRRLRSLVKKPKRRRGRQSDGFFAYLTDFDPLVWVLAVGGLTLLMAICGGLIHPALALVPGLIGSVAALAGTIWFLVKAFQDDAIQGLGCLCVPFYAIYYALTHFDEVRYPACIAVAGHAVSLVAGLMSGELTHAYDVARTPRSSPPAIQRRVLEPRFPQDSWVS
jgi:hypothetical protein